MKKHHTGDALGPREINNNMKPSHKQAPLSQQQHWLPANSHNKKHGQQSNTSAQGHPGSEPDDPVEALCILVRYATPGQRHNSIFS